MQHTSLRQLLYVSRLAPSFGPEVVGRILGTARHHNGLNGETGVLVFDGERFCQLLEGHPDKLRALLRNLLGDARHTDVRILADVPITERRFSDFRMGYVETEDVDGIAQLAQRHSDAAVNSFITFVASCDIEA